jgi:hypothetical protein
MANFNFNVADAASFIVKRHSVIETDCATQYIYKVTAAEGDSIRFSLEGNTSNPIMWSSQSYEVNGVEYTNWEDTNEVTIVFSTDLYIKFVLENSGDPGRFNKCKINIDDDTTVNKFQDNVLRENDSNSCATPDGEGRFIYLTDTPSDYGTPGQFVVINAAGDGLEYADFTSYSVYSSTLDPSVASPQDVGGIPAGTTVADITGDTFSSLFSDLLFPTINSYIDDASNLSIGGFDTGSLEVGTNYSFTAAMSYDVGVIDNGDGSIAGAVTGNALTFNLANPDGVNYTNNSVVSNSDSTNTATYVMTLGSNVWTFSGTNSVGTTTYTNNKGAAEVVSSIEAAKADLVPTNITLSKTGYYPLFYGMSINDTTSVGTGLYLNSDLTKNIASTGNRSVSLNGTDEYVYFAYPSSSGALASIIDGNGFDVTSSFILYSVNVTSSGQDIEWTEQYNIYRTTSVTTVIGQTFDFNF